MYLDVNIHISSMLLQTIVTFTSLKMAIFKQNMVVFIGVLLFSTNLLEIACTIRTIKHDLLKEDVKVVCNLKNLPISKLRYGANKYGKHNAIDFCKPLQDDGHHRIRRDEVRNMVFDSPKKIKGDKDHIVRTQPYIV